MWWQRASAADCVLAESQGVLSPAKRERLVELARAHEFTIFEDDPYIELRFEGERLPTML